jgi:hypothetical protein
MKSFSRLCKYSKKSKNPSVFPLGIRMNPCQPTQGATQPATFNLLRQLAVGTLGFDPFGTQTYPNFGCKENPASSIKTMIPWVPFCIPLWIFLRFFFQALPEFLHPLIRCLDILVNRSLPHIPQFTKPITSLARLEQDGKIFL